MIRTIRTVALLATAVGVGALGVTGVFVAWLASQGHGKR